MPRKKYYYPQFIIKWINFEFWPAWLFYAPMFLYGFVLAIKSKSFSYFTAANPEMAFGGAYGTDKTKLLNLLSSKYHTKDFFVTKEKSKEDIIKLMAEREIEFPIVAKPNVGERGRGVEKIDNEKELENYLNIIKEDLIIQEFVSHPIELGVFYHRFPNSIQDGISSVVMKEFLSITGNGRDSFGKLLSKKFRAKSRLKYFRKRYPNKWNIIIPEGITFKVEPIGNHSRGTKFLDGTHLINTKLVEVFREISKPLNGFYYGRFDIKVNSIRDLYEGKNIKILEINGTNSEPAHIYDPDYSLLKAYREVIKHMNLVYKISQANMALGIKPMPFIELIRGLLHHLFAKK
ncbi:ATP-grasp domain-containing protein [Ancylomarina euxinus]|uniref:ATP-grasp domain-containing protein n=1 Tax=Ancylomarina euxinus TaxID=2283627 RepID=A0A425XWU0_9BACT|nr:ATP-grasp domain-containing protein [Ancylomarina euxinus]MCZ4696307.1 ATP-grasp domain-containing protein [Ancylomarina euxinus]MUP16728.1 ATP-grasp domain-containing protein [Ancylomarina euxinus]RRG19113.1 ATP-grasp domain-containing protein [Ancylomarina euxinus]